MHAGRPTRCMDTAEALCHFRASPHAIFSRTIRSFTPTHTSLSCYLLIHQAVDRLLDGNCSLPWLILHYAGNYPFCTPFLLEYRWTVVSKVRAEVDALKQSQSPVDESVTSSPHTTSPDRMPCTTIDQALPWHLQAANSRYVEIVSKREEGDWGSC